MSSRPAMSSDVQSSRCLSVQSGGLKAPDIGQDSPDNPAGQPPACTVWGADEDAQRAVPPPPRLAPVHLVTYVDARGQTVTVLRRTRAGALRLAQEITGRGGSPRVHRTELARCEEVTATAAPNPREDSTR